MIERILVGVQDSPGGATALRVEPAQERSLARIDALLDAAAAVVDEVGFDRLTTAQVAELSGASIGTVYRYFPDRIALLAALHERAVTRYRMAASERIEQEGPATWQGVIQCLTDVFSAMFRTEPGFRIMRFEEVHGIDEEAATQDHVDVFAERVAEILVTAHGFTPGDELVFRVNIASHLAGALIERAYLHRPFGDERMLAEAGVVATAYLENYYA